VPKGEAEILKNVSGLCGLEDPTVQRKRAKGEEVSHRLPRVQREVGILHL
jgi:hypothetical protein